MTAAWLAGDRVSQFRRVVILRHGQTTANASGIWQGQLDTELSVLGVSQAERAGETLRAVGASRIVTSDLVRAAETARLVAQACGIPVTADARLREIHAGQWQGLASAQVAERFPDEYAAVMRGEDIPRGRTGESMAQVAQRAREAVQDILGRMEPGECVILSTHGGTARSVAAALLGIDAEQAWRVLGVFDNCHWAEVREGHQGWRLASWNVGALVEALPPSSPA